MGAFNRRFRPADMAKLTLSAAALAALPEIADFLEETGKDLRYKEDREGFAHAAEQLRIEHAEPTGDYLARVASGRTVDDMEGEVPDDPAERWQRVLDSVDGRDPGVVLMTPSKRTALRALLAELRSLRARVLDPASTYLVTVKLPKNPAHNPRAKVTGQCPFSDECTDVTGEHHSFLTGADGLAALREEGTHVTRVERIQRSPRFLRTHGQ